MSNFTTAAICFVAGIALAAWVTSGHETAPPSRPVAPQNKPTDEKPLGHRIAATRTGNRCEIDAVANGERLRFIIDSGADGLYFPMGDARRLGFNPARLSYDHTYQEWGGSVRGATVRLREFRLAGLVLHDIEAEIDEAPGGDRLLGMTALRAWKMQLDAGSCVLRW